LLLVFIFRVSKATDALEELLGDSGVDMDDEFRKFSSRPYTGVRDILGGLLEWELFWFWIVSFFFSLVYSGVTAWNVFH
jgi:hypothetical protein